VKRVLLAGLLTAALVGAAPAMAGWSEPQRLAVGQERFEDVALAGNTHGDAAAVWENGRGISIAFARRGRLFGAPTSIPGGRDGFSPKVAIDEKGNVLVLWSYFDNTSPGHPELRDEGCCNGIRLTMRSVAGGRFRRVQALTPVGRDVSSTALAIVNGRVGVAWGEFGLSASIGARFARAGHRLGRAVHFRHPGEAVGIALLGSGPAVTFSRFDSGGMSLHELRVRNGRVTAVRTLLSGLPEFADFAVATNAHGDQAVGWVTSADLGGPVYAGARGAAGRFRVRRVASHNGPVFAPRVAIAPSGAVIVAWGTAGGRLLAAGRRPRGRFGLARQFGATVGRGFIDDVQVGVDSSGRSVIGWTQEGPGAVEHLHAAFRSRAGRATLTRDFGPATDLGVQGTAALDARGRARVLWRRGGIVSAVRGRRAR
jgi:hypothetical protein